MRRFSLRFFFLLSGALFVLFLLSPDLVQQSAHESVLFCASVLIPSLFPCFVLSDILLSLAENKPKKGKLFFRLFRLPSVMTRCFFIGLLAGFPAAADCAMRMVRDGIVSKEQAERALAFTNNPGIVFVVCAVGTGIFGRMEIGLFLWSIQTVTAITVGIMLASPKPIDAKCDTPQKAEISLRKVLPSAVINSVSAVLNICGFVLFFRVLIRVLTSAVAAAPLRILASGLLEMTCGISELRCFDYPSAIAASLILGWSGFSVHFQILSITAAENFSLKYYFIGKGLQSLLSAGLTVTLYPIFFLCDKQYFPLHTICYITIVIILLAIRLKREHLWKTTFLNKKRIG